MPTNTLEPPIPRSERPFEARLEHPVSGKLQQGGVFNCVKVPRYETCRCSGIILTARCDLEHGKFNVMNFLPVVPLRDWARRELCLLLARRFRAEALKGIRSTLLQKGVSNQILQTFPLRDVVARETQGKERTSLLEKCNILDLAIRIAELDGAHCEDASQLFTVAGKQYQAVVSDLIRQNLPEYYFLNEVDIFEKKCDGYVVLLRQMKTIDGQLAKKISAGIEAASMTPEQMAVTGLTFEFEPICMVTAVLRSPDIEHLTQQFSNLFMRIGLEDQNEDTIQHHTTSIRAI